MARRKRKPPTAGPKTNPGSSGSETPPASKTGPAANEPQRSNSPRAPEPPGDGESAERDAGPETPLFPGLPSLSRVMSVVVLVIGILAVGALFYRVMAGFFVPLFLAALLVVIFRPVHQLLFESTGQRPRIAALLTTLMVLSVVLVPILLVVVVAASQFTAMLSRVNFDGLAGALERGRKQVSLSLPHAEQFRSLERVVNSLEDTSDPERTIAQLDEASALVAFLQANVPGPPEAATQAEAVQERLAEFRVALETSAVPKKDLASPSNTVGDDETAGRVDQLGGTGGHGPVR